MTWETLTLSATQVKARWRGDFQDVTNPVPATDETLRAAKMLLRRKFTVAMSPTVNSFPSVTEFLDKIVDIADNDSDFAMDFEHLLASAYRYVRLFDKSLTGGDRLSIAAEQEEADLNEAVKAFARVVPNALGRESRQAWGSQATGSVVTYKL